MGGGVRPKPLQTPRLTREHPSANLPALYHNADGSPSSDSTDVTLSTISQRLPTESISPDEHIGDGRLNDASSVSVIGVTLKDIALTTLDGKPATLAELSNGATLVVNVASKCGLTPQYTALEPKT